MHKSFICSIHWQVLTALDNYRSLIQLSWRSWFQDLLYDMNQNECRFVREHYRKAGYDEQYAEACWDWEEHDDTLELLHDSRLAVAGSPAFPWEHHACISSLPRAEQSTAQALSYRDCKTKQREHYLAHGFNVITIKHSHSDMCHDCSVIKKCITQLHWFSAWLPEAWYLNTPRPAWQDYYSALGTSNAKLNDQSQNMSDLILKETFTLTLE